MLTPADIENKIFKKAKIGGYDINDVEDFLERVIIDYEKAFKECTELKDRVENLQESVAYYKSIEAGIDQTVGNAQEEANKIREEALNEADRVKKQILRELSEKKNTEEELANEKLQTLKDEILKKQVELEEVKKQMQIYKIKTKSMLEAQLKILDEEV